jgi:hypothetical protein
MGRNSKVGDHQPLVYFRLTDDDKWQMIDKLMTLPKYSKSRTSLLNNALDYGLPKLLEEEFGEITLCEEPKTYPQQTAESVSVQAISDESVKEIIRLLKEIAMYTMLNKSISCSLFNALSRDLKGKLPNAEAFENGDLRDTPKYLEKKEIELLKEMSEDNEV